MFLGWLVQGNLGKAFLILLLKKAKLNVGWGVLNPWPSLIQNFRYCTKQFSFNSGHVGKLYKVLDDDDDDDDLVDGAVEDSDTSDDDDIDDDEDDNDMSS